MSTKIVSTPSEPLNGLINKKDLQKIQKEFQKHTKLESTDGKKLKKQDGFYIGIDILKSFIQQAEEAGPEYTQLLLQFCITLPDQKTCTKPYKNIGNTLSFSFFIADKKGKAKDKVGDSVLTAGFKANGAAPTSSSGKLKDGPPLTCCGLPSGGGGGGH